MVKGKFVLLSILAAALLCWQFLPMNTETASSGIVDPCSSGASFLYPGTRCLFICPQGDGEDLEDGNNQILVTVSDDTGAPIPGVLAADIWLVGCEDIYLCAGSGSSNADSATNDNGITTISGTIAGGGSDTLGVMVVVQSVIINCRLVCGGPCLPIMVVSPDIDGDGDVDLGDFSIFGACFQSPPKPYQARCDMDCDGDVDLGDFSRFAQHWQHRC